MSTKLVKLQNLDLTDINFEKCFQLIDKFATFSKFKYSTINDIFCG